MSYQVLARKWRPRSFREMVGQTHVLKALINALDSQRLHHAYLFTGTRGVGKTTIARILAKCLNCETGISSTPCGTCSVCREIDEGRFVDLIEVDAASRTKVEDTRELLDNVQYSPSRGRFKVYLIDEAPLIDLPAYRAGAAGGGADAGLTVQALGQNARDGGLADPTGTGEQVSVMQALAVQCVDQGLEHMGLADHFTERARTPLAGKDLVTHRIGSLLLC